VKQYQIQDLLNQSINHVVYEVVSDSGELFHLIRLIYNGIALGERLTELDKPSPQKRENENCPQKNSNY